MKLGPQGAFSVIVKTDCGTDGSFYSTTQDSSDLAPITNGGGDSGDGWVRAVLDLKNKLHKVGSR